MDPQKPPRYVNSFRWKGFRGLYSAKEEAVIVGRICTDVETEQAEGKLHEGGLYLESSKTIDIGSRGLIKFNPNLKIRGARPGTSSFGLFPGAIAAFKGQNATGDWFQVSEVLSVGSHSRACPFRTNYLCDLDSYLASQVEVVDFPNNPGP